MASCVDKYDSFSSLSFEKPQKGERKGVDEAAKLSTATSTMGLFVMQDRFSHYHNNTFNSELN